MPDDTISTDPKLREEARRAAAESTIPKPLFVPERIARDEFERIVDKRYAEETFEQVWKNITEDVVAAPLPAPGEMYGVLEEGEFRQLCAAIFYGLNAWNLGQAARKMHERGDVLHKAAMFTVNDRLDIEKKKVEATMLDLVHGFLRKPLKDDKNKRSCLIHPNGCPDEGQTAQPDDPRGNVARMILGALLGRK